MLNTRSKQQNLSIEHEEYEMNSFIESYDMDILDIKDSRKSIYLYIQIFS
jgi:hypothetical protein